MIHFWYIECAFFFFYSTSSFCYLSLWTGQNGKFSGGFDITAFDGIRGRMSMVIDQYFFWILEAIQRLTFLLWFWNSRAAWNWCICRYHYRYFWRYISVDASNFTICYFGVPVEYGSWIFLLYTYSSGAKKPSVAAIDGLSLGGGLEIAMVHITLIYSIFSSFNTLMLCQNSLLSSETIYSDYLGMSWSRLYFIGSIWASWASTWIDSWIWRYYFLHRFFLISFKSLPYF